MKIKPIKQRDTSACAPTCIEMVLNFFSVPHTIKEIAKVTDYKREGGMSNAQVVDTLKKFGLGVKAKSNVSWDELKKLNIEDSVIVVSWMLHGYIGHVSVVDKVTDTHVFLAEPTTGKVSKIEKIKFLRLWWDFEDRDQDIWYPETKSDVQLRFAIVVTQ
jgi:ABC-type bacteriocin/lantibiotic exporter with double-glycine peptidase domain